MPLAGGTRFIGVYLARQLVEQGHEVTLFTRGKKAVTYQIPDDSPSDYANFSKSVRHIAGDRMVSHRAPAPTVAASAQRSATSCSTAQVGAGQTSRAPAQSPGVIRR